MAFFERTDDHEYRATAAGRGPWNAGHLHAGPPSALLGGVVESVLGEGRVVRITLEVLRPVEITTFRVTAELARPGRRVAFAEGVMEDERGPVMLARAWRIREADVGLAADPDDGEPMPPPGEAVDRGFFPVPWDEGYHTSMEYRFVEGGFTEMGDAVAWFRTRVPIVEGEDTSALQRVLVAADSGNGIAARMAPSEWLFVNTDLSVHLHDLPRTEWVGMDARTRFGPDGIGVATTVLHGEQGAIGHGHQSLIVEPQRT